jgi:hypothetical protein
LSCKELGFSSRVFSKFIWVCWQSPDSPLSLERKTRKEKKNASEGLDPLIFLDFLSMMGHMKATTLDLNTSINKQQNNKGKEAKGR